MKETPILFSSEMVRAILEGRKTQTRRVIDFELNELHSSGNPVQLLGDWPLSNVGEFRDGYLNYQVQTQADDYSSGKVKCPYGQPGDRLWVKETWWANHSNDVFLYKADAPFPGPYSKTEAFKWRPSRYMPRWASRITLEIDEIRVERLQDITEADATNEGFKAGYSSFGDGKFEDVLEHEWTTKEEFRDLWNSIYSKRGYGWEANPLVWVIKFHRLEDFENEN
jgi:hypothetical protein